MIKSLLSSRSVTHKSKQDFPKFELLQDHGASFRDLDDKDSDKENGVRRCFGCGETKQVSDFPMSLGRARLCRFCDKLKMSGLDVTEISCEGNISMRLDSSSVSKLPALEEKNDKTSYRRVGTVARICFGPPLNDLKAGNAEEILEGYGFATPSSAEFV